MNRRRVLGAALAAVALAGAGGSHAQGPAARTQSQAMAGQLTAAVRPSAAPAFPELTGRVVDQADLLRPEEEAQLAALLAALERRTTDQLVIVTLPSLGGRNIGGFSRALGNHWGIGQAGSNNGVLLVVAPVERQVRIEVGSGLERILTNARAAEIIRRDILPEFRRSRWRSGIAAGARAIVDTLTAAERQPRRSR